MGVRAPSPCPKCWWAPPERLSLLDGEPQALGSERGQQEIALPAPLSGLSLGAHGAQVPAPSALPRAGPQTARKGSLAKARAFRGAGRTDPWTRTPAPEPCPVLRTPVRAGKPPLQQKQAPASTHACPCGQYGRSPSTGQRHSDFAPCRAPSRGSSCSLGRLCFPRASASKYSCL